MTTDYNSFIDANAVAQARERHRQVCLRMDTAQACLAQAEAAHAQAQSAYDAALDGSGDPAMTLTYLRKAADALKIAQDTVPAIQRAIERSEGQLQCDTEAARLPAREKAESDLLQAAKDIDALRAALADAFKAYRAAAIACSGLKAADVNASPAHAGDAMTWASLPSDRSVADYVKPRLRTTVGNAA